MFKSIFRKMLFVYITLAIFIISAVAFWLSQFFNMYYLKAKQDSLINQGIRVKALVEDYNRMKLYRSALNEYIDAIGNVMNTRIFVLNIDEKAIYNREIRKKIDKLGGAKTFEDLERIVKGETVINKRQFSNQLNTDVVFVGMPYYEGHKVKGAVLLYSPLNEVDRTLKNIYKIILVVALVSIFIASIIIYLVSKRMSEPIICMSRLAEQIADGYFVEKVEAKGQDEIAKLAESINYMNIKLIKVENMRRELIANVSHDLRTPLTSIKCIVEGMQDGIIGEEEYNTYFKLMYDEIERLSRLVEDLLQLAKLQSGSIKLNRSQIDIRELIYGIIQTIKVNDKNKDINIQPQISDDVNMIIGDSDRLKQIIINLINNSIKYSGENLLVSINIYKKNDKIVFEISDNGIGIPEGELPYIFEKFYRVDKSRESTIGGTGLGLSITRNLVELHGGNINAESQLGIGTKITFELPFDISASLEE